jgi:RNA polymerase sigma factor (sigma-70 family)
MREREVCDLVTRALGGDELAWNSLVHGLSVIIFRVARAYRLGEADVSEVSQNTWLSLARRLPKLREPERLPGWLVTTARRHALALLARRDRELSEIPCREPVPCPELSVLSTDRDRALWSAVGRLPARSRRLVWLLAHRPELTHAELAAELGIRPGSVGPLRKRCFDRVRTALRAEGYEYP